MEIKGRGVEAFLKKPPAALRLALVFGPDQGLARERADAIARTIVEDPTDPFRVAELAAATIKSTPPRSATRPPPSP